MGLLAVARNHQRRTTITLYHARGGDADDPAVPTLFIDYDTERIAQPRLLFKAGRDGLQDASFFLLTIAVQLIEPFGDLAGPQAIFHAEQFDDVAGHVHSACGIDARGDAECDFSRREGATAELRDIQQSLESWIHG